MTDVEGGAMPRAWSPWAGAKWGAAAGALIVLVKDLTFPELVPPSLDPAGAQIGRLIGGALLIGVLGVLAVGVRNRIVGARR
jgi:hypothetical protein